MWWLDRLVTMGWSGAVEVVVLAALIYAILVFFEGTRGAHVLFGFIFSLVALLLLTELSQFDTLNWLVKQFTVYLAIAFVVIFQPEIRRALAELGRQHVFTSQREQQSLVGNLVKTVNILSDRKIGALIAVQREIGMKAIMETGTMIEARLTPELLASIFYPHTPLHDGGVIVQGNRVEAAACLFPLSRSVRLSKTLGTRHRAAVGLTEETDAVVLVVSEETGTVSVAYRGRLRRGIDEERLRRFLTAVLKRDRSRGSRLSRVRGQLNLTPEVLARMNGADSEGGAANG